MGDLAHHWVLQPGKESRFRALAGRAGDHDAHHFIEFSTVNIRNPIIRAAYRLATAEFLRWCEGQRIAALNAVQRVHVAAYVEQLGRRLSAPSIKQRWLGPHEKNGKLNEITCHHKLKSYLDAYIDMVGISGDRKGPLFRNAILKAGKLGKERRLRRAVLYIVHRRGSDAGLETKIGYPTFRATGITDYLTNGERIEVALKNGRKFKHENHRPL